jgi:hypothetical protein
MQPTCIIDQDAHGAGKRRAVEEEVDARHARDVHQTRIAKGRKGAGKILPLALQQYATGL